jgi:hypothetical protein
VAGQVRQPIAWRGEFLVVQEHQPVAARNGGAQIAHPGIVDFAACGDTPVGFNVGLETMLHHDDLAIVSRAGSRERGHTTPQKVWRLGTDDERRPSCAGSGTTNTVNMRTRTPFDGGVDTPPAQSLL